MKERQRGRRAMPRGCEFGTRWPTGVSLPGNTSSACLHLLLRSFNDFFFLIGLMSLSLVLRAVSYFTLVPFHCSSYSNHFFTASWVGHLNS